MTVPNSPQCGPLDKNHAAKSAAPGKITASGRDAGHYDNHSAASYSPPSNRDLREDLNDRCSKDTHVKIERRWEGHLRDDDAVPLGDRVV